MKNFAQITFTLLIVFNVTASAQQPYFMPKKQIRGYGPVSHEGPRFGFTVLTGSLANDLKEDHNVSPVIAQLGWQYEKRFYISPGGAQGITEFVPLIGGFEQGVILPSLNWLVGVRGDGGAEFAVGANLSAGGSSLVVAAGTNFQTRHINFPLTFAFVPSKSGVRFSLLCGFNSIAR